MNLPEKPNGERRFLDWLIAGLGIVLAILLFFLVRQYQVLRREAILNARESWLMNAIKNHPHLTADDVSVVSAWMTFDYVNTLFNLPPDYLKAQLSVLDAAYPKLTINKFANESRASASSMLAAVQAAIRQYLAQPVFQNTSST